MHNLSSEGKRKGELRLYCDLRYGGVPRYILSDEPPPLMQIPAEIRKCVAYVGYRLPTGEMSLQGTAFFVQRVIEGTEHAFHYLVTAAHLIRGISSREDFDGKILLRVNSRDGNAYTVESSISLWKFHPDESEIDVAVMTHAAQIVIVADVLSISTQMFFNDAVRTEYQIDVGDEVFLTGLFYNHSGKKRNIPIVRAGNIAAMPEEKVLTKMGYIDAYLVEARSIGGISGSPVFVYRETPHGGRIFSLLGLMHGHYDIDLLSADAADMDARRKEAVNMGIAIVVPSEKILEVLGQPMIKEKEDESEAELRKGLLPTMDSIPDRADEK